VRGQVSRAAERKSGRRRKMSTESSQKPDPDQPPADSSWLILGWTAGDWAYSLEPEGHLWRWNARWVNPDPEAEEGNKIRDVDFGLVPGGAFAALTELVFSCDQVEALDFPRTGEGVEPR
jgi:hypothetical protein